MVVSRISTALGFRCSDKKLKKKKKNVLDLSWSLPRKHKDAAMLPQRQTVGSIGDVSSLEIKVLRTAVYNAIATLRSDIATML